MSVTVIGLYKDSGAAQKAARALVEAGCHEEDIAILGGEQKAGSAKDIAHKLVDHGFEKAEAEQYGAAVEQGHILIAASIVEESADATAAILDENGALDLEEISAQPQQGKAARSGVGKEETIPVIEEQVEVGKRRVSQGGARVTSKVVETPVRESVQLREEQVDVDRRKADRTLSDREADAAFEEKTREMTATSEKPEVTKEARVVGEVTLSKKATEREQTVEDTARRTDVKVERTDSAAGKKR